MRTGVSANAHAARGVAVTFLVTHKMQTACHIPVPSNTGVLARPVHTMVEEVQLEVGLDYLHLDLAVNLGSF